MNTKDIEIKDDYSSQESPVKFRIIGTREALAELAGLLLDCIESKDGKSSKTYNNEDDEFGYIYVLVKESKNKEKQIDWHERLIDKVLKNFNTDD